MSSNSSLEKRAGQRIMAGFDGLSLNNDLKFLIKNIRVNGIILFKRNIGNHDQVKELIASAQDFAKSNNIPKLFIAIDQEGGTVSRLKEPFTQFRDGAKGINSVDEAVFFAKTTAKELKSIGVNMNMAPVLDIDPVGFNGIMNKRALGNTPDTVTELGMTIIKNLEESNIMSVCKHFPGIGKTVLDSHFELPVLDATLNELQSFDLKPFLKSFEYGVSGVMVSHILYNNLDSEWPASLSPLISKVLLREKLGYKGVVITDDLDMKAVKCDIKTAVKQVLLSDIDIPLICRSGKRVEDGFEEIMKYLRDDSKLATSGEKSLERIKSLKQRFLFQPVP
jgi:beta-N-acetylhexosaminidase